MSVLQCNNRKHKLLWRRSRLLNLLHNRAVRVVLSLHSKILNLHNKIKPAVLVAQPLRIRQSQKTVRSGILAYRKCLSVVTANLTIAVMPHSKRTMETPRKLKTPQNNARKGKENLYLMGVTRINRNCNFCTHVQNPVHGYCSPAGRLHAV